MPILTPEFSKSRGKWLMSEIRQAVRDRQKLDGKLELVRALYWMDKDPGQVPWAGASDIHLPVIYEKIETSVPKLTNAFWGTEPIVHVKRVPNEFMPEETDNAERLLNWGLEEDIYPNFYDTSESWFRNALRDGLSTVKVYWVREWEKTVEVHKIKAMYDKGQISAHGVEIPADRAKTPQEVLLEIFGHATIKHGLLAADPADTQEFPGEHVFPELVGQSFDIEFIEERRKLYGHVVINPSEYVDEVNVHVYRQILKHDRPMVEVVEFEDLIVPFRTPSLEDADWVAQQYWLSKREIRQRYESGLFDISEEDFKRLMSTSKTRQDELEDNEELKDQKDRVIGEGEVDQQFGTAQDEDGEPDEDTDFNKLLFFEIYIKDDVDDDGDPIEVIYHVSNDLSCVVSCDYLSELFPHNRRPFATIKYKTISDRWYGQGMGEILVPIQLEVNTIVNYINNNQELINNPFFFYIPSATMVDPGVMKGVCPGDGIPIGDPNGVIFPKFQQQPLANLSAMDTLLLFADRVTISPMGAGSPQVRNAPRTARGTMSLLAEGNVQLDNIITRWQRTGWEELMHQLMGLYQDYLPEEKYIYVTGDDGTIASRRVHLHEIRGRFMFTFTGNTVNTNREVLRSIAQVRYNTIMTHPDMAQDPVARREALHDLLRHYSEGVDITRLLPALPGQGGYQHAPMQQDAENQSMLNGIPLDALPVDDHQAHLQSLDRFAAGAAFETMPEDRVILFAMHKKQHLEMMQQQARMATQPVSPGMGNNVPTGMTQNGGSDMNALEGGVQ
jgi:hypothetical protein